MQTHGWLKHQRQGEDMRWARVFRRGKGNSVWAGEGGNKYKSADLFFYFFEETKHVFKDQADSLKVMPLLWKEESYDLDSLSPAVKYQPILIASLNYFKS